LARWLTPALLALALAIGGCGEGGASAGATVSVYVGASLCREAQRQLSGKASSVEDLHVRAICLPSVESAGHVDLAQAGANARRATEDSTSVAYLEAPGPAAEFSRTIVESADIAWFETSSGATAMRRILHALDERGSSSPRAAVLDQVS
jgi:hypothetical protein